MNPVYISLITLVGTALMAGLTFVTARRADRSQRLAAAAEHETTQRVTTLHEMEVALEFTGRQNKELRERVLAQDQRIRILETEQENCRQETARLRRQIFLMGGFTDDDDRPERPPRL